MSVDAVRGEYHRDTALACRPPKRSETASTSAWLGFHAKTP